MNSRDRVARAMRLESPDRVPVMCQLALGHYFLHTGLDPVEIWHDSEVFAEALVLLQRRYDFDGILVNLPGRDPDWRRDVAGIEPVADGQRVVWRNGWSTVVPRDDNAHVYRDGTTGRVADFDAVDPERLYYIEPHDISGVTWPWRWGFAEEPPPNDDFFPPWQDRTLRAVRERAPELSVHGEVFSPFTQLMELLGFEQALMTLIDEPDRVEACLAALAAGTVELMGILARAGADAVLISSAFAGGGFISPDHYRRFVLPCEKACIEGFRAGHPDIPVYTHTCGAIGDRLELMEETGTQGIDTLDPPPLGTVELADAVERLGGRLFIKGNMDPVNTVLKGTPESVQRDAAERIRIAGPGGGYILSTACSVPPAAPPENILAVRAAADAVNPYEEAS